MNIITSSVNTLPKNVRIASDFHFNLPTHLEGFWAASSDIGKRTTIILLIPLIAYLIASIHLNHPACQVTLVKSFTSVMSVTSVMSFFVKLSVPLEPQCQTYKVLATGTELTRLWLLMILGLKSYFNLLAHFVGGDDRSFIVAWHYQGIKRTQRRRSYQSRSKQAISISSAKIMLHFYK